MIILVVLAALVAGFAVFMLIEPAPPAVRRVDRNVYTTTLPAPPSATQPGNGVGAGQNVWIQTFDKKSGQLVSEFRAARYDPPVDNVVHVVDANARFYQKNGSIMRLSAKTGDMVMPEQARKSERMTEMNAQAPSHGVLNDVTLELFDDADTLENKGAPSLTCTMPILAFDNDTLSLATIAARLNGQDVLADRIPVTVRGRDYDFDGAGLKLRYNQRDQHLEFLEVAHGRRLLIKHPKNVGSSPTIGGPVQTPSIAPATSPAAMKAISIPEIPIHAGATARFLPEKTGTSSRREVGREILQQLLINANDRRGFALPVMLGDVPLQLADVDPAAAAQASAEEREKHRQKRLAATQTADERAAQRAAERAAQRAAERAAQRAATRAATRTATTEKAPKPPREIIAYHATFDQNVKLMEGTSPVGDADQMVVTFTFEGDHAATQPATNAATDPGAETIAAAAASIGPALTPLARKPASPAEPVNPGPRPLTTEPTAPKIAKRSKKPAAPATKPAAGESTEEQPIEVTWDGKLTVVPIKLADSGLENPGDHIVEFTGRPAHLSRQGSSIEAPYVWAGVDGERFAAKGNAQFPIITLRDEQGLLLKTRAIDSDGDTVIVHGESVATNTIAASGNTPAATMVTKWTDSATLHLVTTSLGDRAIDRAKFVGDVDVRHPHLHARGDTLDLGFAESDDGKQPSISAVKLDGNVLAAMKAEDGSDQTIAARTLDLATAQQPDGSIAVKTVHAAGAVKAVTNGQTLKTDDLVAELLPSANAPASSQPAGMPSAAALDHLIATGNVQFNTPAGQTASADILKIDRRIGNSSTAIQDVSLIGNPAVVTDPTSRVTGKLIKLDSTGQMASVVGAGTLDGVSKAPGGDNKTPPRPMSVTWTDALDYNGANNRARVSGNVAISSRGADGSVDRATGKTLDLVLADAPSAAAQPATQRATPTAGGANFGMGGGGNKILKQMTLSDGVEVSSILCSPIDPTQLQRRLNLLAPQVVLKTAADGSIASMHVPSAGRMLLEDHSKDAPASATQPAATQSASTQPANGAMSSQGKTAIAWSKDLTYDTIAAKATLLGDVVVVHQMGDGDSMRLTAPRMTADLDTPKDGSKQGGQTQIKQVVADGGAVFQNSKIRFDADHATYEPGNDRVIATGSQRQPVQVFDQGGLSTGSFDELWWNLKTNQPERLKNISVNSRGSH